MAEGGANLDGWEISVLFVLFMCISCAWQIFIAIITFLNNFYGPDAKKIWLTRLKEEVLDVGVISLALVFVQPYIANICVSSSQDEYPSPPPPGAPVLPSSAPPDLPSESPGRRLIEILSAAPIAARRALAGASADPCPPGKRHLFPANSISTAHYLLFFVALVHIVYSLFTFTLTLQRFSTWARWERHTRLAEMDGAEKPTTDESAPAALEEAPDPPSASRWRRCSPRRCMVGCWRSLTGGVDPARYKVLRGMFQLRARAYGATSFGSHNLHYSMICENAMQIDIENVVAHGWLQALIVAIFTLYTTKAYQIVWVGGLSIIAQVVVMVKLQSVMVTIQRIMTVESLCFGSKYRINTTSRAYQELSFAVPSSEDGSRRQIRFSHLPDADDPGGEDWPAVGGGQTTLRRRSDSSHWTQANHGARGGARKVRSLPSRSVALAVASSGNAGGAGGGGGGGMTRAFATSSTFGGFGGGRNAGGMPHKGRSADAPPQPLGRMSRGPRPLAEGWEDVAVAEAEAPSLSRLASGHSWWMSAEAPAEAESSDPWGFCRTAGIPYGPAASAGMSPWARALQPWADGGLVGWAGKEAAASSAMQGGASRKRLWGPGPVGGVPAARSDGGGRLPAGAPGPVAEAQDWGFGSGGSRGGRGSRGATRGRSNSASRSSGGGGAGAAAGKAAVSSGGGRGGRINIMARGGFDTVIEPASLGSGVGPGPGGAGAGSEADTERGGLGHFLAPGYTTDHGNPLYDAEQGTASLPELLASQQQSGNFTVASGGGNGGGSGGGWGVFGNAAANAAAALANPGTTGGDGGDHSKLSAAVSGRLGWFGGKVATGDGGGGGAGRTSAACSTAPTSGCYGELLEVASSSRFANPLFREGTEHSESLTRDAVEG
ncbi:hypothetical protein VaNZ11_000581, partial [Volvox africanus]